MRNWYNFFMLFFGKSRVSLRYNLISGNKNGLSCDNPAAETQYTVVSNVIKKYSKHMSPKHSQSYKKTQHRLLLCQTNAVHEIKLNFCQQSLEWVKQLNDPKT